MLARDPYLIWVGRCNARFHSPSATMPGSPIAGTVRHTVERQAGAAELLDAAVRQYLGAATLGFRLHYAGATARGRDELAHGGRDLLGSPEQC